MLLLKNLNLVKNIAFSQQSKCHTVLNLSRSIHSTFLLQAQKIDSNNQAEPTEKIRVYYGKIVYNIVNWK